MRSYISFGIVLLVLTALVFATAAYVPAGQYRSTDAPRNVDIQAAGLGSEPASNSIVHDQVSLCNLVNALWLSED